MTRGTPVVVVGAGLGGLAAAARVARDRRPVIVLERSHHPGGTAWEFTRFGFSFPMGPLGYGNPRRVQGVLASLGAARPKGPDPTAPPPDPGSPASSPRCQSTAGGVEGAGRRMRYRLRAFGLDIPLSESFDDLVESYGEVFAQDAGGIRRFFDEVVVIADHLKSDGKEPPEAIAGLLGLPAAEWIGRRVSDRRLRRILGSQGTAEPYAGVPLTAAMWDLIAGEEGIVLPEGGIGAVAARLLSAIRAAGGEVRLGYPVGRIVVENGRAAAVITAKGERIDTPAVISNADAKTTVLRLLGPGDAPDPWRDAIAAAPLTGSVLQVSLGIDPREADMSAFDDADRVIFRRRGEEEAAVDWNVPEVDAAVLAGSEIEIALWKQQADGASIVLRVPADHAHFARFRPAPGRRVADYASYKIRLARALVAAAEEIVPGLGRAARVTDVATPLTFEERGGRYAGSVAGWSWDFGEVDDGRLRDLTVTPVAGLYLAGCQARSALFLGGIPTALASGVAAAEAAMAGVGPAASPVLPPRR